MMTPSNTYHQLIDSIDNLLKQGRRQAAIAVNYHSVHTYWEIGRYIVEYEQQGEAKAEYGSGLLIKLSKDLTIRLGKGFSKSNVFNFRKLFLYYEKFQTPSEKLPPSKAPEIIQTLSGQSEISETLSHQI